MAIDVGGRGRDGGGDQLVDGFKKICDGLFNLGEARFDCVVERRRRRDSLFWLASLGLWWGIKQEMVFRGIA